MTAPPVRMPLADWIASGRFFDWSDQRIFVRGAANVAGGEPLLLIHVFPTASWDWEAVWPALAARWPLLTLDLVGFGASAKPVDFAYSIAAQADLCEALLASEGVTAYHVLAHDYGDTVAQELLARQLEPGERPRLSSVVFLNGGLFPETHRPALIQRLLLSPLGPWIAQRVSRAAFARNLRRIFGPATPPDDDLVSQLWELVECNGGRAVMPKLIRYMVERRERRARWVGALQSPPVPLALVDGAADPISGAHMAARFRELVADADVTLLEGIGHYPQIEAPAHVVDAYLAFRTRVDPSGPIDRPAR
jgi:pimeloyl-ACP methyl ester carboxylesterase